MNVKNFRQRFISFVLVVIMIIGIVPLSAINITADDSIPNNAIHIKTAEQLASIGENSSGKYYVLDNDINLVDEWIPIDGFSGTFDGQGYSINNLYVLESSNRQYAGLFGRINTSEEVNIKNVGVNIGAKGISAFSSSFDISAGGLIASCSNNIIIENCYVTGNISSSIRYFPHIGGLIGSYFDGKLTIKGSYSAINISAISDIGTGTTFVGGLIGHCSNSYYSDETIVIENCYATGDISAQSLHYNHVGGLIGYFSVKMAMKNCYFTGNISSSVTSSNGSCSIAGGLIGEINNNMKTTLIENCYTSGNISAFSNSNAYAGGMIGRFYTNGSVHIINNCYTVSNIYTNYISSTNRFISYVGGLIGNNYDATSSITVNNSYRLSLQTTVVGGTIDTSGIPLTAEQMKNKSSFVGWDFDKVWDINSSANNGYPYLRMLENTNSIQTNNVPIIIIPGIMGSQLYSDPEGKHKVWVDYGEIFGSAFLKYKDLSQAIGYDKKCYVINNQVNQVSLNEKNREYGANEVYKKLVNTLCDKFPNRKIYFFSYDWRQSNMDLGKELKKYIDEILKAEKVDIVCHSMGGIVTSNYVADNGADKINKIITIATPYEGSPKIINVMLNYSVLINKDEILGNKNDLNKAVSMFGDWLFSLGGLTKEVKTKFPSSSELVPSKELFNFYEYYQISRNGFLGLNKTYNIIDYQKYNDIKKIIYNNNYNNAETLQNKIKRNGINILAELPNSYFIVGIKQATIASLAFSEGTTLNTIECTDLYYEFDGDGTVPYLSATMMGKLRDIENSHRIFEVEANHTDIVEKSDETMNYVVDILNNNENNIHNSYIDTKPKTPYTVIRVACPVDVTITRGNETLTSKSDELLTSTSFGRLDFIGKNDDIKMICIKDDTNYNVILNGTDTGKMDYSIRWYDGDNSLIEEQYFNDVDISNSTVITTNTNKNENIMLNIDENGDGIIDKTINPIMNEVSFSDVKPTDWFYPYVKEAVALEIVNGRSKTIFDPYTSAAYADTVAMMLRAMNMSPDKNNANDWSKPYIDKAVSLEIYDSKWKATDIITRERMAMIVSNSLKMLGISEDLTDKEINEILKDFIDKDKISAEAKEAVAICIKEGLITGVNETIPTLDPQGNFIRAQMATIAVRFKKLL